MFKVKSVSHKLLSEISELPHHVMIVEFFKSVKLAASNRDRLDRNEDDFGCSEPPTEKALKFLDKICEDCYHMYKDSDVYDMCRWITKSMNISMLSSNAFLLCFLIFNNSICNALSESRYGHFTYHIFKYIFIYMHTSKNNKFFKLTFYWVVLAVSSLLRFIGYFI